MHEALVGVGMAENCAPAETARRRRRTTAEWLIVLIVAGAGTIAPLAWAWIQGATLLQRDSAGLYAPLRRLAGEALRSGRLPLWNPFCATGMPFLGETVHGVLHPVSVAVAFLFPSDRLDPLLGGYVLSAGIGAAVCARIFGASLPASVIASFAYGLSGYILSMTGNLVFLAGGATVPWVLAGLRAAGARGGAIAFIFGSCAVASGVFSGDIQALAVSLPVGLLLAWEGGRLRGFGAAVAASGTGLLLAGVQLLPSWEFVQRTNRALPLPGYDVNQWDLAPWRLIELVSPGFFWVPGDGWQTAPVYAALGDPTWFGVPFAESVFIGIAVILLACAAIPVSRTARVLAGSSAIVLWFAMGRFLGARLVQNAIPVVAGFRYGEKYLVTFLACLAILVALGTDRVVRDRYTARRWTIAALAVSTLLLSVWVVVLFLPGLLAGTPDVRLHLLRGLPQASVAGLGAAGSLFLASRGMTRSAIGGIAAVIWLSSVAASPYALRPGRPEARVDVPPPALSAPAPGPRIFNVRNPAGGEHAGWDSIDELDFAVLATLGANANARFGIDNFSVDTGLFPLRWFRLNEALKEHISVAVRRYAVTHLAIPRARTERGTEETERITENGRIQVADPRTGTDFWEIPHRPWASFPERVVTVGSPEEALRQVVRSLDTGSTDAVVESMVPFRAAPGEVLSLVRSTERLQVAAESAGDATLVINDAYCPGWRATIDGAEVPILPADALVRAVPWPAGRHSLVMTYEPREVALGKQLSALGLAALTGGAFLFRRRTWRSGSRIGLRNPHP